MLADFYNHIERTSDLSVFSKTIRTASHNANMRVDRGLRTSALGGNRTAHFYQLVLFLASCPLLFQNVYHNIGFWDLF